MFEDEITKGLAVAEQEYGTDFTIDCDRLSMRDPGACVLGQLGGNYYDVVARLAAKDGAMSGPATDYWSIEHGFMARYDDGVVNWITLTEEWRERLRLAGHCA